MKQRRAHKVDNAKGGTEKGNLRKETAEITMYVCFDSSYHKNTTKRYRFLPV